MSGRINRIPPGLLGVLGTQAMGQNPNDLAGFYQCVIESRDWLLATASRFVSCQVTGIAAPGTFDPSNPVDTSSYIVPPNEYWLLYSAAIECQPAGVLTGQLRFVAQSNAGLPNVLVPIAAGPQASFGIGANGLTLNLNTLTGPLFLPPGSRPQFVVSSYAAAAATATIGIHYARLF